jgi:hypothetical protein
MDFFKEVFNNGPAYFVITLRHYDATIRNIFPGDHCLPAVQVRIQLFPARIQDDQAGQTAIPGYARKSFAAHRTKYGPTFNATGCSKCRIRQIRIFSYFRYDRRVYRFRGNQIVSPIPVKRSRQKFTSIIVRSGLRCRPTRPAAMAPSTFTRASSTNRVSPAIRLFSRRICSNGSLSGFLMRNW